MKKVLIAFSAVLVTPLFAFAALENISDLVASVKGIVGNLIPVAFGLALLAFFWGLAVYIFKAGDEDAKAKGKNIMIGGIIALFVMFSIWGIVLYIQDTLGVSNIGGVTTPKIN